MKSRLGLWIILAVSLGYVAYLGAHWLPLGMSEHELSASASRVWDIKREIVEHHYLPWWTPNFMSGSSYGLHHSRGFYLLPWMFFSMFTDLMTAGKLTALLAIVAGAITMYFCARHFMRNEWAAVLAALAFMLHPEQIIRAAGAEHITIILFLPFIPLLWLTLARALERNTFRDTFLCAVVAVLAWWMDNKQAFISFLFLFCYAIYWLWPRRQQWQPTARVCGLLAAMGLALGAWVLAPGVIESSQVKLFIGDPLTNWQRTYSFKSLLSVVDRNGTATSQAVATVLARVRANGGSVGSQAEVDQIQRLMSLGMEFPEKYMGFILVLVIVVTVLGNDAARGPAGVLVLHRRAAGERDVFDGIEQRVERELDDMAGIFFAARIRGSTRVAAGRRGVSGGLLSQEVDDPAQESHRGRRARDLPVRPGLSMAGDAAVLQGNQSPVCVLRYGRSFWGRWWLGSS